MFEFIINKILFVYIVSLYTISNKPGLNIISNSIAAVFVLLVVLDIFLNRKKIRIYSTMVYLLIFILICSISYFVSIDKDLVTETLRTLILNYVFIVCLFNYVDSMGKVKKVIKYYVYSGTIASIFILVNSDIESYQRVGSILGNENSVGIVLAISFILAFYLSVYRHKHIYMIHGVIILPSVLLSGSRKSIVILVLTIIMIVYFVNRDTFKKRIKFIFISVMTLCVVYFMTFEINLIYRILGRRLESLFNFLTNKGNYDSSVKMRDYLMRFGIKAFMEKPILGYGIDNYRLLLKSSIGVELYSHNNLLELLVGTGVIGAISFYLIYWDVLYRLKKLFRKKDVLVYTLFSINIVILLMGYGMVHYTSKHFLIFIALSTILDNLDFKRDRNRKNIEH